MCLSCGCGSPNDDHGDQRNITMNDIDTAAQAAGTTREKVLQNIASSSDQQSNVASGQNRGGGDATFDADYGQSRGTYPQGMQSPGGFSGSDYNQPGTYAQGENSSSYQQNGYQETEVRGYGQPETSYSQPANPSQAQQGYDPTHSGVRHAQNQPGTRVDTPGRETGTSWGEDQQMGYTTDTPDRRNPAE